MLFQPSRKSFGVLLTAFPDTLRAFRLLRVWQRRALLRCASDQVCWKSKRLRRIRSLRLCESNRHIVGGKGQHRRGENSDNSGDHADERQRLCREVDAVHCAHPAGPTASYSAERPDASASVAPATWRYSPLLAAIFPPRLWLGQRSDRQAPPRPVNFLLTRGLGYAEGGGGQTVRERRSRAGGRDGAVRR